MAQLTIETKEVKNIREFIWELDRIRPHQVYFQKLFNGDFIARVITLSTNEVWLENEIKLKRIHLPLKVTFAEPS